MKPRPVLLLLTAIFPLCGLAASITVPYSYEAYGNTLDGALGTPSGPCTAESYTSQLLSISNCSASGTGVSTSADSLTTFTTLKADSWLTLTNASLPLGIDASGYGRFEDLLTLVNGSDVQFLALTMHLDGTLSNNGLTNARMSLSFGFDYEAQVSGGNICSFNLASGTLGVDTTCTTGLIPIAMFLQHPYWFSLSTQEQENAGAPLNGSASSNFFSTATLVSASPYDGGGHFLSNVIVSSQGNGGTPFNLAPVPEPSAAVLIGLGLASLTARFRFRRPQ